MPHRVRILLLGPPAIYKSERPLAIARREVRAMLYYLACQRGSVSRGDLIAHFWIDHPEEAARKRLRETLARLKSALPDEDTLLTEGEEVRLNPARFTSDVTEFLSLVDEVARPLAQSPAGVPLPEAVHQKMLRAVRLWRAPHFLSGARLPASPELEAWVYATERSLHAAYLRLLERLADHHLSSGSLEEALTWLQSAVAIDPINDALHERIIAVYERGGWHADALLYLQRLREQYAQEGFDGLPQALRLTEQRLREGAAVSHQAGAVRWPGRRAAQVPLFGRHDELEKLRAAYRRGGVVLLLGEAGSGKTRLVQELFRSLEPSPRLMAAVARPMESSLPFQPFIDMLRYQVSAEEWRALPRLWLSAMQVLLPELGVIFPELPSARMGDSLAQPLLFEAIHQTLLMLSRSQRLLIFLDDLHWCDDTSLNAAAYLVEHGFFGERGALVMACRLGEQPPALLELTAHLQPSGALLELPLGPLPAENAAEMARYVLERELPSALLERIQQNTGGNPLFLLENLRALLDFPVETAAFQPGDPLPIAGSLHAQVHQRLERLSADAQQVLTIAAVIGSEFRLDVLEQAANLNVERLASALEELERRRLLQPVGPLAGITQYRFSHDLVREIIHLELSPVRRRVYHLRVAAVLQQLPGAPDSTSAAVLARHYEEAGETQKAFSFWLKAGLHARSLYAQAEAFDAFKRAEQLLEQIEPAATDEEIFQLYSAWGEFGFNIANAAVSEHAAGAMLSAGFRRTSPLLIGWGYLGMAAAADLRDQAEQGLLALEQARGFLEQINDPLAWMLFHYRRGGFLAIQNRYGEAIQVLEQALGLAGDSFGAKYLEARTSIRYRLAITQNVNGWPAKARKQAETALEECRQAFNHAGGARAMTCLALSEHHLGQASRAAEHAEIALRMIAPMKNLRLGGMALFSRALARLSLGHLDEAWQDAALALEGSLAGGFGRIASQAWCIQGAVMQTLGQAEQAEALFRRGLAASPDTYAGADCLQRLGELLVSCGRIAEGLETLEQAIALCRKYELNLYLLAALVAKARALSRAGSLAEAVELANRVAAQASERELPIERLEVYLLLAEVALEDHRPDEANQKALLVMREARELSILRLEVEAAHIAARAAALMGRDSQPHRARLQELLGALEAHTHRPELRPAFENYAAKLSKM